MKLVYIAGKYTGKTFNEVDDNIKKAEAVAIELVAKLGRLGFFPITPHLNTAHFEIYEPCLEGIDYYYWLKGTKELLLKCDLVLMMEGWKESKGAVLENKLAHENKIPVFYSIEEIKECY